MNYFVSYILPEYNNNKSFRDGEFFVPDGKNLVLKIKQAIAKQTYIAYKLCPAQVTILNIIKLEDLS